MMAITTDVVTSVKASSEIINGSTIVVSCNRTGVYQSKQIDQSAPTTYTAIEIDLTHRIDAIGYYYQIGGLRWIDTATATYTTTITVPTTVLDWKLVGSEYWIDYSNSINSTAETETISDTLETLTADFVLGSVRSRKFSGGVLLPDGTIFCMPFYSTLALIYNPNDNTTFAINGSFGARFRGGVLLPNEKVLMCPQTGAFICIYDIATDTTTVTSRVIFIDEASGCVLLPNGNVYFIPDKANSFPQAKLYNPNTNTLSYANGTFSGTFGGGVLLPNGKVFCVPADSTTARIYDPVTNTLSVPAGTYPGSNAFYGAILLGDGRIVLLPRDSTKAYIYDYATDTLTISTPSFLGSEEFLGGCYLGDGTIYLAPHNSTIAKIYNPINDTVTTATGTYSSGSSNRFYNAVSIPDGKAFPVPYSSFVGTIYGGGEGLDINILLSAYYNKG